MSNLNNGKKAMVKAKMEFETTEVITTNVYKVSPEHKEKLDRPAEDMHEKAREVAGQRITIRDSDQIHEITKLLALCWDENRELSFGEMIDHIFSFAKDHTQNEFWNMEAKQCLNAIGDFREKKRLEREKYINEAD